MKKLLLIFTISLLGSCTKKQTSGKTSTSGIITTIAGNGLVGFSGDGGAATAAELSTWSVAVDGSGNVYIADAGNNRIRKVNSAGIISTIAGNGFGAGTGHGGYSGDGGAATTAELYEPTGIAIDGSGNIYIADLYNNCIRKVNPSGTISTIAGTDTIGYGGDGEDATAAKLDYPIGVAVDGIGNVYIGDEINNRIRKVNSAGIISTIAGNGFGVGTGSGGYSGDGGAATAAELYYPFGVAVDGSGNVYFADGNNNCIRKINASGTISTFAGNGFGARTPSGYYSGGFSGDGGAATAAELYSPIGVAVDGSGNVYIADEFNNRIRKVNSAGIISTIAGNGFGAGTGNGGYNGDGGAATAAELNLPTGVAVDADGNVYISDDGNRRIRKVSK